MRKYLLTLVCGLVLTLSGCATKSEPQMPTPMNVYFEHASTKVDSADVTAIKNYVAENEKFVKCPKSVIFVGGHANSIGTVKYNDKLSQKRADAIRSILIKAGVPSDKIRVKAYGSRVPIADNNTEKGLKINRRAEIGFMPLIVAQDCAKGCGCGMQPDKCTCKDECNCKTKKECGCGMQSDKCTCKDECNCKTKKECSCGMQSDKCTCKDECNCKTKKCPNSKRARRARCAK